MYFQAGDLILKKCDSIPSGSKKIISSIIHKGLNHTHGIKGKYEMFENGADIYVNVKEKTMLTHQEHKDIELNKGLYKKEIVKEYDHWTEEAREVID